jgi:hypothetical protein
MATLRQLADIIAGIVDDDNYDDTQIIPYINDAVLNIASGLMLSDGRTVPPLPNLHQISTIATATTLPYISLPSDYHRNLFYICDSNGDKVRFPKGGDYYSFMQFMVEAPSKLLDRTGNIDIACVKGNRLYYQPIPATSETLSLYYYRKPVNMLADDSEPDGVPDHLQIRLIKHWVCREIFGELIEDGQDSRGSGVKYHTIKFEQAAVDLIKFIGFDKTAEYLGGDITSDNESWY